MDARLMNESRVRGSSDGRPAAELNVYGQMMRPNFFRRQETGLVWSGCWMLDGDSLTLPGGPSRTHVLERAKIFVSAEMTRVDRNIITAKMKVSFLSSFFWFFFCLQIGL